MTEEGIHIKIGDKVRITNGNKSLGTASGTTGIVMGIEIITFPARWWKRLFLQQKQEWRTIFRLKGEHETSFPPIRTTSIGRNDIVVEKL